MRRSWIIGLCIAVLAGMAGAAETVDEGWQTYRNEKFGYALSYPADMAYTAYVDGASGVLKDTRTVHRLVGFEVWPPPTSALDKRQQRARATWESTEPKP